MWKHAFLKMEEAFARLKMLSEVSSIARTGLKMLEKMLVMINNSEMARSFRREAEIMTILSSSKSRSPSPTTSHNRTSTRSQPSSFPLNSTNGSSVLSFSGQPDSDETFGNPITTPFPYDYSQIQDD